MDKIIFQAFYWDCPKDFYKQIINKLDDIAHSGFTSLYLPPPYKGYEGRESNGFDVHDHFDLGEYKQRGTIKTKFGSKKELLYIIKEAHNLGLEVFTELILTRPPKVTKSDVVYTENERENYKQWIKWLTDEIGFDGFRIDGAKGVSRDFLRELKATILKNKFCFLEVWSGNEDYVNDFADNLDNEYYSIDFPLFYQMKNMCDNKYYDMRNFINRGYKEVNPFRAVTFVANHDTERFTPIIRSKEMGYAYNLFYRSYTSVFWQDYYEYNLKNEIDKMIKIRNNYLTNETKVEYVDENLAVLKNGDIYLLLNNFSEQANYNLENCVKLIGNGSVKGKVSVDPLSYLIVKN